MGIWDELFDISQRGNPNHELRKQTRLMENQIRLQSYDKAWGAKVGENNWRRILEKVVAGDELNLAEVEILNKGVCPDNLREEFNFNPDTRKVEPKIVYEIERADDV